MNTADTIEVTVERILPDGYCVSKETPGGKALRFPFSLPGEKLRVRPLGERASFIDSDIVEVLSPSPHRVKPACPCYTMCGGCTLSHASLSYQRELKLDFLKSALDGKRIEAPEIQVIAGSGTGYRARVTLDDGGFYRQKSREVIPIERCLCATDEINSYLSSTPYEARPKGRFRLFGSRYLKGDAKLVTAALPPPSGSGAERGPARGGKKSRYEGTSPLSGSLAALEIAGKTIEFDARGFFQSNIELLIETIPLAMEGLGGKIALDMYSGYGVFSSFLADRFENIVTVEHNKGAVAFSSQNLRGVPHESYAVSGADWVKYQSPSLLKKFGAFDAAFIDPPRSGMEREVRAWLARERVPVVRSLSCDAVTHARDLGYLTGAGYKIKRLYLLDFFPQTMRIESLAELEL